MTAKEKAKEIFDKMYSVKDAMGYYQMSTRMAKECALISVGLTIDELKENNSILLSDFQYYNQVILEIEHI